MTAIYPLDFAIVIWGIIGTYRIRQLIQLRAKRKYSNTPIVVTAIVFILVPIIVLRTNVAEYSAFGIIAVCAEIFWFAILVSRSGKFT
ncbi:MAG: hypothetical protein CL798_01945 [Chromatiales bacterium]|jgi:hypothetical protein|nr:hypothetical protein [Chromatiales bacterium]